MKTFNVEKFLKRTPIDRSGRFKLILNKNVFLNKSMYSAPSIHYPSVDEHD
jgi:hypothetical protein